MQIVAGHTLVRTMNTSTNAITADAILDTLAHCEELHLTVQQGRYDVLYIYDHRAKHISQFFDLRDGSEYEIYLRYQSAPAYANHVKRLKHKVVLDCDLMGDIVLAAVGKCHIEGDDHAILWLDSRAIWKWRQSKEGNHE